MFGFQFDRRMINIIIGILLLAAIIQFATNPGMLFSIVLSIPGVLVAITFHEFAHAFAADKLGDDTARREGRLNLNPLSHLDPIGTLMLVFAGFGWGKPVHVNPTNYTRRISMEKGEAIVSVAGPIMNILLAIVFTIITFVLANVTNTGILLSDYGISIASANTTLSVIFRILISTITINVGLGVFNLIPLPPLDGSKIIMPFLPYKAKQWFINNEQIFYIVFIVLWISGLAGRIISPAISFISMGIMNAFSFIL